VKCATSAKPGAPPRDYLQLLVNHMSHAVDEMAELQVAIMAPFCITIFRLPIAAVAGATLAGTFATSVISVIVYSVLPLPDGGHATPEWALGSLFGLGVLLTGLGGMNLWP
jgi:hypothetical protein